MRPLTWCCVAHGVCSVAGRVPAHPDQLRGIRQDDVRFAPLLLLPPRPSDLHAATASHVCAHGCVRLHALMTHHVRLWQVQVNLWAEFPRVV